jgi:acetylornithine deacetylase
MKTISKKTLEELLPDLLESRIPFFQKLVQTRSTRGREDEAQMLVRAELEDLGLKVKTLRIKTAQGKIRSRTGPVVVGVLKGAGGGKALILNSHIDCAPAGPRQLWKHDPFSGMLEEGRIHGRGSLDDKAGCITILLLLDLIRNQAIKLKGDLIVHSVVEDEYSGRGTECCMIPELKADAAIIIDGHYDARLAIGHPGHIQFKIKLYGKPAPSCRADAGESAIEKSLLLIKSIRQWSEKIHESLDPHWTKACEGSLLNIGKIQGGEWVGAVPASCTIEGLMRFAPPFTLEEMKALLLKEVHRIARSDPWLNEYPPVVDFKDLSFESLELATTHPFFAIVEEAIEKVMHKSAEPYLCPGWCDLRHLHNYYSIPACMFGPGRGQGAHRPNEYFQIKSLLPHARVLMEIILEWCLIAE